jgi:hypothetical protein
VVSFFIANWFKAKEKTKSILGSFDLILKNGSCVTVVIVM